LTKGFAHPQASYQSPRNSPQAQTDADTQGKIHHARPGQKSPWCATISPRGTGFIRLSLQRFQALLTLFSKSFSPFPHGTCLLSVSNQYLALDEIYHPLGAPVPRNVTRRQRAVHRGLQATDGILTLSDSPFPRNLHLHLRWRRDSRLQFKARGPDFHAELFPVHSPLLGESCLVSFPPLTYMLKFSG
jgi:hypothetical protein